MGKKTDKADTKQTGPGQKRLWNDWRLWLLGIALLISLAAINPHYVTTDQGDTTIGTDLKKGLDLKGGTQLLVQPTQNITQEELNQIVQTLRSRVNAYGLAEVTITPVGLSQENNLVKIEAAGTDPDTLKQLVARQGKFEARFYKTVSGNDTLTLGSQTHQVTVTEQGITTNGQTYAVNDTFTLNSGEQGGNISITVANRTENTVRLSLLAFTGSDIKEIVQSARSSRFGQTANGAWQFQFQVVISQDAAEQFYAIAQTFSLVGAGDNARLSSNINFFLDNEQVDSLTVSSAFQDSVITTPSLSGGAETREQAKKEEKELKSILQSGSLPVPIEIVSTATVSAALGEEFTRLALTAILLAVLGVSGILFARYQDYKIAAPIAVTGFSEVFILLGFFSELQIGALHAIAVLTAAGIGTYFCYKHEFKALFYLPLGSLLTLVIVGINPTLDLPAIAGIIAAVGTGVDDQIVMADEGRNKKLRDLWDRIKRAFFIIFTAAASTIGAMIPLYFVGAGALRGFATTTVVGILIGIFITRPAYAQILVHFHEDYEE